MKRAYFLLLTILLSYGAHAQKTKKATPKPAELNLFAAVDAKALALPASQSSSAKSIADYILANFTTDSDKVRAAFIWTASNIEYDVAKMYALNSYEKREEALYEKREERIDQALKTHKGVCRDYASVLNEICRQCGIKSFMVSGYTKSNGIVSNTPHAWCAATIDNHWYFFDPTWASGYVSNDQFTRKLNNNYYKIPPTTHIKSHMPFDPMWECLNYVVTNEEFYAGKTEENKSKPFFSYADTITVYERMNEQDQMITAEARLERNGVKNAMVSDQLDFLKRAIEIRRNNDHVELYNSAAADFNSGVKSFNEFIDYRNNQFNPIIPDAEIQAMFDEDYNKLVSARTKLSSIQNPNARMAESMNTFNQSIDDVFVRIEEQKKWLQKYFSKGKFGRARMLGKYAWTGIPVY